jgi:hypothetical protein
MDEIGDIWCATTSNTSYTFIMVSRYSKRIHVHNTMKTDNSTKDSL